MKKSSLLAAVLMMILHLDVNGITPVFVGEFKVDTSLYDNTYRVHISYIPGPFMDFSSGYLKDNESNMFVCAYLKKNSNQFDFYSYTGKIGTSIIPVANQMRDYGNILFSRNMLDEDANWESIVFWPTGGTRWCSKVFDDDGTELLSDTLLRIYYGFDGNSTYVVGCSDEDGSFKAWRFRTNIASSSHPLAKSQSASPGLMTIYGQDNGNYRVTLSPSSGNQVNFQMFDLLGRCIFSKQINNITSPQSFTIPEQNVPKSPFVAKFTDKNGSVYKKQIPVK
jgi:hypothetical protein